MPSALLQWLIKPSQAESYTASVNASSRPNHVNIETRVSRSNDNSKNETVGKVAVPKPKFNAMPFTSIGSLQKEVLIGARGKGVYLFDHKTAFTTRTSTGTVLTGTAVRQADNLSCTLTGSHAFTQAGTTLTAVATSSGALDVDVTKTIASGLRGIATAMLQPGPLKAPGAVAGKLGLEYGNQYIHAKATSTLDPKPVLGVTMATGSGPLQAGVDMVFSTARAMKSAREAAAEAAQRRADTSPAGCTTSAAASQVAVAPSEVAAFDAAALVGGITRWTAAVGYKHQGHQLALFLSDNGSAPAKINTKLAYAMNIQDGITLAAEMARDLPLQHMKGSSWSAGPLTYTLGMSAKLSNLIDAFNDASDDAQRSRQNKADGQQEVKPLQLTSSGVSPHALVKLKLDSRGIVSALYSDKINMGNGNAGSPSMMVTWSAQMDSVKLWDSLPKLGVALELI